MGSDMQAGAGWTLCTDALPDLTVEMPAGGISSARSASEWVLGLYIDDRDELHAFQVRCGRKHGDDWGSARSGELFWCDSEDRGEPPLAWMPIIPIRAALSAVAP